MATRADTGNRCGSQDEVGVKYILNTARRFWVRRLFPSLRSHGRGVTSTVLVLLALIYVRYAFKHRGLHPHELMPGLPPWSCPRRDGFGASAVSTAAAASGSAFDVNGETRLLAGWPKTPVIEKDDTDPTPFLFKARASKMPNGPILSTGSALLHNGDTEFRAVWLRASLNYTGITSGESVESDICLSIFPQTQQTSLSSGEEVLCTHEHYFSGDNGGGTKVNTFVFKNGGFPLQPGQRLDVGSVSKIYTAQEWHPLEDELQAARTSPDFLALHFEVKLVRADSLQSPGLRSARSPMRDRSIHMLPQRESSPYTTYKNVRAEPVPIDGIGVFKSMLVHYMRGDSLLTVLVDGAEVFRQCLPAQAPGKRSTPFQEVVQFQYALQPGSEISVVHTLGSDTGLAPVFDFAAYIFYEHPDFGTDALVAVNEEQLGGGHLDLNGDHYPDYVDYDADGHVWTEMTKGDGVHDTQHATFFDLITKRGKFNTPTTTWEWTRGADTLMSAKVTETATGGCFHLRAVSTVAHEFEYCDTTALQPLGDKKGALDSFVHGDFDGDGYMDRCRFERNMDGSSLAAFRLYLSTGTGNAYTAEKYITAFEACNDNRSRNAILLSVYRPSLQRHILSYILPCSDDVSRNTDANVFDGFH